MKIKFEIKASQKQFTPLYTIYLESKNDDLIELRMTHEILKQRELNNQNPLVVREEAPIEQGILSMNKANLKKFIGALQLLVKS